MTNETAANGGDDQELALKIMVRQLEALRKDTEETRKANESKDLDFSAQRAIAGFEFAAPSAKDDFFRIIRRSIEKAQDGKIYSREGYSLTDFARKEFEKRTWFQAPPNISGSGAHSGAHGQAPSAWKT